MIGVASKVASLLKVGSIRTMGTKPKKRKRKIKVSQKARIRKKSEQPKDTIPRMKAQMPRTTGAVLRVKLKRKND